MNQRRNFTPQFKARVVLEVLTKLRTTAQVCREYDLKEQVVTRWKAEFLERAPTLFASERQQDHDQARIAKLERLVGRLTMELEIAKKVSQLLDSPVSGKTVLNRGQAGVHRSTNSRIALERRPRCLGGCQRDGGTRCHNNSSTDQQ